MASPSPRQLALRRRIEGVIGLAAPFLDGMLAAGERLSKLVGPEDEPYPVRPPGEAFELVPAVRPALDPEAAGTEPDAPGDEPAA